MTPVTQILSDIESGNRQLIDQLMPLVYDELRAMAARQMAGEKAGHLLEPTALVHDVWLRLVDAAEAKHWGSRKYFFAAAAEAMRRILVDHARARLAEKRGGARQQADVDPRLIPDDGHAKAQQAIVMNDAIEVLSNLDASCAELVKLRYFGGFSVTEAGEMLGMTRTDAYQLWKFAKAWLAERTTLDER